MRSCASLALALLLFCVSACSSAQRVGPKPRERVFQPTPPLRSSRDCISWKEAADHIEESTCVWGIVSSTVDSYDIPLSSVDSFHIYFSQSEDSFFAVSFREAWADLEGRCVILVGTVENFEGRPGILIRNPKQLYLCQR